MYTRWILLGVALSQLKAQSSAQMNCFLLTNTKACPGMGAYAVQSNANYSNVDQFDNFIERALVFENSSNVNLERFNQRFECSWTGHNRRYYRSVLCFRAISNVVCPLPAQDPPVLCRDTCNAYLRSLWGIFENPSICNPNATTEALSKRQEAMMPIRNDSLPGFCSSLTPNGATCKAGLELDFQQCGFEIKEDAKYFCSINSSGQEQPCCIAKAKLELPKLDPPEYTSVIVTAVLCGGFLAIILGYCVFLGCSDWKKKSKPVVKSISREEAKLSVIGTVEMEKSNSIPGNISIDGDRMIGELELPSSPFSVDDFLPSNPYSAPVKPASLTTNNNHERSREVNLNELPKRKESVVKNRWKVTESYVPERNDELELHSGQVVIVQESYSDGWAEGELQGTGDKGVFPLGFVEKI